MTFYPRPHPTTIQSYLFTPTFFVLGLIYYYNHMLGMNICFLFLSFCLISFSLAFRHFFKIFFSPFLIPLHENISPSNHCLIYYINTLLTLALNIAFYVLILLLHWAIQIPISRCRVYHFNAGKNSLNPIIWKWKKCEVAQLPSTWVVDPVFRIYIGSGPACIKRSWIS